MRGTQAPQPLIRRGGADRPGGVGREPQVGVAVGIAGGSDSLRTTMLVVAVVMLAVGGAADMASAAFRSSMLQAAADDAGVSEVQKTLRGVNDSLGSASNAARKFSERKLTGTDEAPAPKPVVRAPAVTSPVVDPVAEAPAAKAAEPAPGAVPEAPDPERKAAS